MLVTAGAEESDGCILDGEIGQRMGYSTCNSIGSRNSIISHVLCRASGHLQSCRAEIEIALELRVSGKG